MPLYIVSKCIERPCFHGCSQHQIPLCLFLISAFHCPANLKASVTLAHSHFQEAYVRGVSAWNFDVAALKSNAAMEGATELATVPEVPGRQTSI